MNNQPDNLCVLKISDHKWLHKQYGNATLWAHYHGKVSSEDLISWSDDKERARMLVDMSVVSQKIKDIGIVVDGKLIAVDSLEETQRGAGGFGSTGY
jgi:hypothetical protein